MAKIQEESLTSDDIKSTSADSNRIYQETPSERAKMGKAVRSTIPRSSLAAWDPPSDRPDPVELLEGQAVARVPELVPIRYGRMMASPFAFYRGAAVIMASDLSITPNTGLNVQLCGDAHLSNFGGFASPERELILDLNDFDETLPGPWEWDVKRLAASMEIAGRERNFKAKTRSKMVSATVSEYQRAMREFAELRNLEMWYLHLSQQTIRDRWGVSAKPKAIKSLDADLAKAYHKDNMRAYEKLTYRVNGKLRIVPNPPLIVPVEDLYDRGGEEEIEAILRGLIRGYRLSLRPDLRYLLKSYRYAHVARKVVGVGSVGTLTWILLMLGRDDQDPLFLQVKEAKASVLEPYLKKSVYSHQGRRVVEGQRLMQAASDIFLGWERVPSGIDGKSHDFYIRQLWDWKVSADPEAMNPAEMRVYGRICAWTLARAHARSGDRIAIAAYIGKGNVYNQAMVDFATKYADQNERDYQSLISAVNSGRIMAETGF